MVLSDDVGKLMNQTVFIQPRSAGGLYGPTFGEGANYDCYIERSIKVVKGKDGKDAVSSCQIFLDPLTVGDSDKITLNSLNPPIIRIDKNVDENGDDYSTVIYT
jgi:hypothetical protein